MAKKAAKETAAKKAAKETAAKKAVKDVAKKTPARKNPAKKSSLEKAPAKKTPTAKSPATKVSKKVAAEIKKEIPSEKIDEKIKLTTDAKKVAVIGAKTIARKNLLKRVAAKKTVDAPDEPPIVIKRRFVPPEKLAKLSVFEKKQRQRLLDLRDQITDSIYGIQNDTIRNPGDGSDTSGSGMHQGDAGSDAYDRDFALSMLSNEANALGEIEEALHRLDLGTYGVCEESGQKIPKPRLEAIPFARLTVECQAAKEKEASTRDFGSREFGYS